MISPRGATRSEQDALEAAEQRGYLAGYLDAKAEIADFFEREGHKQAADRLRQAKLEERK